MNLIHSEKMDKITLKQGDSLFKQEDVEESMFVCIEGLLSSDVDGIESVKSKPIQLERDNILEKEHSLEDNGENTP